MGGHQVAGCTHAVPVGSTCPICAGIAIAKRAALTVVASAEDDAKFREGYDQAVAEVMSEVKKRDRALYLDIVAKFPTWMVRG